MSRKPHRGPALFTPAWQLRGPAPMLPRIEPVAEPEDRAGPLTPEELAEAERIYWRRRKRRPHEPGMGPRDVRGGDRWLAHHYTSDSEGTFRGMFRGMAGGPSHEGFPEGRPLSEEEWEDVRQHLAEQRRDA